MEFHQKNKLKKGRNILVYVLIFLTSIAISAISFRAIYIGLKETMKEDIMQEIFTQESTNIALGDVEITLASIMKSVSDSSDIVILGRILELIHYNSKRGQTSLTVYESRYKLSTPIILELEKQGFGILIEDTSIDELRYTITW